MSKPPPGWPRISSALFYQDPAAAIDWLEKAFGFVTRVKIEGPDGQIVHSELELGDDGLIMVGGLDGSLEGAESPDKIDGRFTQSLFVYVDDVDAHCKHAADAGARIVREPTDVHYGDRNYLAADLGGHVWCFAQRIDQAAWDESIKELAK